MKKHQLPIFTIINTTLLAILGFMMVYPFIYILSYSFNDGVDSLKSTIYFLPRKLTLHNYAGIFKDNRIFVAYKITIMRTVLGTFLHVSLCTLMAYALSKKLLPGRKFFTFFIFLPVIFNAGFIPTFILLKNLHLINTFWVYIIPFLYNFFNIIIIRTFLQQLPVEMEESAKVDGYGDFQIFIKIILPLSGPVLATISLFIGVVHWNDWFSGTYYVNDKSLIPVQTLLNNMLNEAEQFYKSLVSAQSQGGQTVATGGLTPESIRMAVLTSAVFPVLCIYPFVQKYFTKGALLGSIKG